MDEHKLSEAIESLLVAHNPRNMKIASAALPVGYYLRAARRLQDIHGTVIIGTGFPVKSTFETDGPVGAIALYSTLAALGAEPVLACGGALSQVLGADYRVIEITAKNAAAAQHEAQLQLRTLQPSAIIAIELPGRAHDGHYYNMRGQDITAEAFHFDAFFTHATCPTIAIGDGGNEIGMGNIVTRLSALNITPSVTCCDELLIADVSNWGAYGLIAFLGLWAQRDLLAEIPVVPIFNYLSQHGSVDGVTGVNSLTEDGMGVEEGLGIIQALRALTQFFDT